MATPHKIGRVRVLLAAGAVALPAIPAAAQTVDYQALQETLGEPVTTSVTGKPQRASELPASTVIITREDIARSPARDVPGLLKTYAGIDVNRWTSGQTDVAVRGGVQTYNARLLVLVDGRQVYLDHYGLTNWNMLGVQPEEIQQIELVRGPASALFGFNAASGVVNIITRRNDAVTGITATGDVGNHGIHRVAGSLRVPLLPTLGLKLAGAHARENERDLPADRATLAPAEDTISSQISGELAGSFDSVEASVGAGHATDAHNEYLPSQLLTRQHYRTDTVHAKATRDTGWGGLSFNSYINWLNVTSGDISAGGTPFRFFLDNRIVVTTGSALVRLDSLNTVRIGVEYRNNRIGSNLIVAEHLSYDVASGNAMLDLHPTDAVSLTAAGRVDRLWLKQSGALVQPAYQDPAAFDRSFTRFSFNAAMLFDAGGAGQFRLNGGHGYQLPSLINFGLRLPVLTPVPLPLPILLLGSPNTDPVGVWSGELGWVRDLHAVRLEATGFVTRTTGAIGTPGDGLELMLRLAPAPALVSDVRAVGNYTNYGVELAAGGAVDRLTWRGNYTWTHTDQHLGPVVAPYRFALSPADTTAEHKANVTLGYVAGPFSLSGNARYTSHTRQFAYTTAKQLVLFRVHDAVALDARAGFRLRPGVELFAAGENLTVADGAAGSPIPADRRVRAGVRLGG